MNTQDVRVYSDVPDRLYKKTGITVKGSDVAKFVNELTSDQLSELVIEAAFRELYRAAYYADPSNIEKSKASHDKFHESARARKAQQIADVEGKLEQFVQANPNNKTLQSLYSALTAATSPRNRTSARRALITVAQAMGYMGE